MRWDNLFDDLEGQLDQELGAEEIDLRAEEERLRLGRLGLRDRIRGIQEAAGKHSPTSLAVQLTDGSRIAVRPTTIGRDWFSATVVAESRHPSRCVIPIAAVSSLHLTREQVLPSLSVTAGAPDAEPTLSERLTLSFVLRDLCRRRRSLEFHLLDGTVFGTVDRVGRDHLDVAVHEVGSARRESAVSGYRVVPMAQLLVVKF
ncbi:hypothetical protein [Marisediminicola senii]|uniref:hypothetical protein n=1 Tax=Marisediminicola senii TaxID=2711233 RepID=UPI0013EE07D3|nr:hypothetical protein [Marisediminicola senii]